MDNGKQLYYRKKYQRCFDVFKLVYTILHVANLKDDHAKCKAIGISYNAWRVWSRFEGGPNRANAAKIMEYNTIQNVTIDDLIVDVKAIRHEVDFELNTRGTNERIMIRGKNLTVQ